MCSSDLIPSATSKRTTIDVVPDRVGSIIIKKEKIEILNDALCIASLISFEFTQGFTRFSEIIH